MARSPSVQQLSLWSDPQDASSFFHRLDYPDLDFVYYPTFLEPQQSAAVFEELMATAPWAQDSMLINGKEVLLPRLTTWFGEDPSPHRWTDTLLRLKAQVERAAGVTFNFVHLNLYRNGQDSVTWHRDREAAFGKYPVIAGLSLGATRRFMLKHQTRRDIPTQCLDVADGSLFIMRGSTQERWFHQVPKTQQPVSERISLTFRVLRD